jgi:glycosyltransferase involved in cell wall biosynthesis
MTASRLHVHALVDSLGFGGAELLVADFARVADAAGIELSVAALRDGDVSAAGTRLRAAGVEPVVVPVRSLWRGSDVRRVRAHLERVRPDILHTHLGYADVLGGRAARGLGLPSVSTIHADWWGGSSRERVKARVMALARRRCAERVIAVSDSARRIYLERGWDTPERVVVVRNGIAAEPQPGSGGALRAELGIAPEETLAVMVSRLGPEKAHDVAIDAVAIARGRLPGLRLLIVGDGELRGEVERRAAASLGDAAIMAGHRDDVMRVLDAADLLLHPSRYDAFPTVLLEAMAASVPVLATATGGIVEIVDPGETGILVEAPPSAGAVARELERLAGDAGLRRRLAEAGRARFLTDFQADAWAARTRSVYDEVLAARYRERP